METRIKIFIISLSISIFLFLIAFLSKDIRVFGNALIISIFVLIVPQSIFSYLEFRRIKEMEEKFPIFLRDVIENLRAGLPLYQAIYFCSKYDYGVELTKEIRRMANKISWGVRLEKVLDEFTKRASMSKKISIAIQIIKETYLAGGDVVNILEYLAESLVTIEEAEKERRSILNQYVFMMYALSIIFLVIVVSLHKFLVPLFLTTSTTTIFQQVGISNPCVDLIGESPYLTFSIFIQDIITSPSYGICDVLYFISSILFVDFSKTSSYYISLFFLMIIVQAVFSGLVAGEVSYGSLRAGIRHSLFLLFINAGIFLLLVGMGIIK